MISLKRLIFALTVLGFTGVLTISTDQPSYPEESIRLLKSILANLDTGIVYHYGGPPVLIQQLQQDVGVCFYDFGALTDADAEALSEWNLTTIIDLGRTSTVLDTINRKHASNLNNVQIIKFHYDLCARGTISNETDDFLDQSTYHICQYDREVFNVTYYGNYEQLKLDEEKEGTCGRKSGFINEFGEFTQEMLNFEVHSSSCRASKFCTTIARRPNTNNSIINRCEHCYGCDLECPEGQTRTCTGCSSSSSSLEIMEEVLFNQSRVFYLLAYLIITSLPWLVFLNRVSFRNARHWNCFFLYIICFIFLVQEFYCWWNEKDYETSDCYWYNVFFHLYIAGRFSDWTLEDHGSSMSLRERWFLATVNYSVGAICVNLSVVFVDHQPPSCFDHDIWTPKGIQDTLVLIQMNIGTFLYVWQVCNRTSGTKKQLSQFVRLAWSIISVFPHLFLVGPRLSDLWNKRINQLISTLCGFAYSWPTRALESYIEENEDWLAEWPGVNWLFPPNHQADVEPTSIQINEPNDRVSDPVSGIDDASQYPPESRSEPSVAIERPESSAWRATWPLKTRRVLSLDRSWMLILN